MIRTGIGFDVHPFADGRRLVLGGVEIAGARGLAGHSDADVLCHALADALLGAVAYGDIGEHFPDSDPRWKDADSLKLLAHCAQMVTARDARIINVDATVLAEYPKLAPHRERMRERLAAALQLPVDRISIKATTMEKLGSIGRGEGIAVIAIATVEQST
ncbi:MAG: 2-C-methyl-D-erythritol 2,4-cyclodiphosphate synthase [Kiritimatiellia bacterium]|jgi:2-C-methyl-D-erythritol 2,4-cyclodiphosphate synthase